MPKTKRPSRKTKSSRSGLSNQRGSIRLPFVKAKSRKRSKNGKFASSSPLKRLLNRIPHAKLVLPLVLFALVGSYLVFFSKAATITLANIEAETMIVPAGASLVSDAAASGGQAAALYSNGTATGSFSIAQAATSITINAKGTQCQGAPEMVVKVDGTSVHTAAVSSTGWSDYSVPLNLPAGSHTLDISFTNDYTSAGSGKKRRGSCDRNLYVDTVTLYGTITDSSSPTAPVLAATPGDKQASLSWTDSSNGVGITRYEVWHDSVYVAGLPSDARTYTATGLVNGSTYNFRVVAYDDAGNYTNSNIVAVVPAASSPIVSPSMCSGTTAPFPSRLKASDRNITDENGCVMPKLKGFNMHVGPGFTWPQANFNEISAMGGKINRAVLHWDQFEPSQGVVADLTNLDQHIARAQAAGMYTLLELHLNVNRSPSWATQGRDETEKYAIYGQKLTQALAQRYGSNKSVIGFGLNEPPLADWIRNSNDSVPWLEQQQSKMISWMRAYSPGWIGFVTYGYASATPIYNDSWQNSSAIDANPRAYDAVGGNVIVDIHDYTIGCTNTDPNCDGRQWNGMGWPTYQGGPMIGSDSSSYTSTDYRRSQARAFLAPYKNFTQQANMPLMIGEWGWAASSYTGETAWIADKKTAWAEAGSAIEIHWNYDVSAAKTPWSAKINDTTWRPSVLEWMK